MAMIKKNKFPTGGPMGKTRQYTPRTRSEVKKKATESLPEGVDAIEAQMLGIYDDAREYANWWYDERATQDKYKAQLPADALQAMKDRLNKATFDTSRYGDKISKAPNAFRVNAKGAQREAAIRSAIMKPTLGGLASPEDGIFWAKRMNDGTISHEGIGHIAGDQNNHIQGAVPYVPTRDELAGEEYNSYSTRPNERNAQVWDFRYENRNLKDDNGNYYIDPNRQLTPDDMKQMRDKGVKLPSQWKSNNDEDIIKLHNTIADTGSRDNDPFDFHMAAYGGNLFALGGPAAPQWNIQQPNVGQLSSPVAPMKGGIGDLLGGVGGSIKSGLGSMGGGMLSGISSGISGAISGGMSTGVGGAMQAIGGIASNIPGVGGLIGAGVNVLGGLVNRAFGSSINEEFVNETKAETGETASKQFDNSSIDSVIQQQMEHQDLGNVQRSQVGKDGWFSKKAKKLTERLNRERQNVNKVNKEKINLALEGADEMQDLDLLANYSAYGGQLYADGGGIHIKKANRGKFTEYCGGKVTSECIRRGKNSSSPAVRKRATFAQNARNWHADGGPIGQYWDNIEPLDWRPKEPYISVSDEQYLTDRWSTENPAREGWHSPDNTYAPHGSAEGGRNTVGPGIKLGVHKGFKKDRRYSESELNSKAVELSRKFEGDVIDALGTDTISPQIIRGLVDLSYQVKGSNLKRSHPKLLNAVRKGNLDGIRKEAEVTWVDKAGKRRKDTRRNNYRNEHFWYYSDGGPINTHGGIFTNGITIVGEGGTHEQNPNEGVQMGVDPQGLPNLVEEGEVIFNDYVFSDRLKVPKRDRKRLRLREGTFADAAEKLQKESEERPNDPISKRGLEASMSKLARIQERIRERKRAREKGNKFEDGGPYKTYKNFENIKDDWYTPEYMSFVNSLREGDSGSRAWLDRINSEEFGPVGGNRFTDISDIQRLATDRKRGPVHNAMSKAAQSYSREQASPQQVDFPDFDLPDSPERAGDEFMPMSQQIAAQARGGQKNQKNMPTWMRYAPVMGSAMGVINDAFRDTDYSNAESIRGSYQATPDIGFTPVGNKLAYKPLDTNYEINKLDANTAAQRRAITNTSGGNRATAMAGLLAANNSYGNQMGDLYRQAEEYNQAQKERVEGFNRQTNMYNSEGKFKADASNQQSRAANADRKFRNAATVAQMRQGIYDNDTARRDANISGLLQGLGDIGYENFGMNMANSNPALQYGIGKNGRVNKKKKGGRIVR